MKKVFFILYLLLTIQSAGATSGGIVIDPGHSPKSPGAISCTGKAEYLYNAVLAETVFSHLKSRSISALVSHHTYEEMTLSARARSSAGRRLLISIHHDSVQPQFISKKNRHPCSNKAEGFSIFVSSQNNQYAESLEYARSLGMALRARGMHPSLHHSEKISGENRKLLDPLNGVYLFDDLVVLKKSEAPAILLEAAVIVNPEDEARAASALYQLQIATAIADVIESKAGTDKL